MHIHKTSQRAPSLLTFPSGMKPSRAGLSNRSSKPRAPTAQHLCLCLPCVSDDSWHRNQWWAAQTCHVCLSSVLYACVYLTLVRHSVFLGALTLAWQDRLAHKENWVPEVMNYPTGQEWPESTVYPNRKKFQTSYQKTTTKSLCKMFCPWDKTGIHVAFFWIKKYSDRLRFHDGLVTWIIREWLCLGGKLDAEGELLGYLWCVEGERGTDQGGRRAAPPALGFSSQ